jgi:two-component system sensor histidine kinase SenX3
VDSTAIVVAFLVGIVFGGLFVSWVLSVRARLLEQTREQTERIPPAVFDVIRLMEAPVLLLDSTQTVVAGSPAALALGLVLNRKLVAPEILALVERMNEQGHAVSREIDISRDPSGDTTLTLSVSAVAYGEKHSLVFIKDKSDARRLDEIRRDFVANISHELKTPIGAIRLLSDALLEAADDPGMVRKFADSLNTEALRLTDLTGEIIDLSRVQSEGALADFERVRIDRVLKAAIAQNKVAATAKDITVIVNGSDKFETFGDEPRLTMAFKNLVSNAVQYSGPDSRISIEVGQRKGFIEVSIIDHGIGMSEEELGRIFERFYRTDDARSRLTGGTGLGLSMVKHIISNHGGDIRVKSKQGEGSTFTVRLPNAAAALAKKPGRKKKRKD